MRIRKCKLGHLWGSCVVLLVTVGINDGWASATIGKVRTGVDTMLVRYSGRFGWDFAAEQVCTTFDWQPGLCFRHIRFAYPGTGSSYPLEVSGGFSVTLAGSDWDSIGEAFPDSILEKQPRNQVDNIPFDSLAQWIGKVYVLRTDKDPRNSPSNDYYVKLKILDFLVVDAETHAYDMTFLWAYNTYGYRDLTTNNVDTFTLDYHVDTLGATATRPGGPQWSVARGQSSPAALRPVLRVGSGGVWVVGTGAATDMVGGRVRTVWDLRGRRGLHVKLPADGPPRTGERALKKGQSGSLMGVER